MNEIDPRLVRARRQSEAARTRLTGTLVEIQNRLRPAALIDEALEDLREKADEMAHDAIEMVKARPLTAAGVVLAVLAYLFRGQLLDALGAVLDRAKATEVETHEFEREGGAGEIPALMEKNL